MKKNILFMSFILCNVTVCFPVTLPINNAILSDVGYCLFKIFHPSDGGAGTLLRKNNIIEIFNEGTVNIFDENGEVCRHTLKGHNDLVCFIEFNIDETRALTLSRDGVAKIWDLTDGNCLQTWGSEDNQINAIQLNKNGTKALFAYKDTHKAELWDLERKACLHQLQDHTQNITSMQFSFDEKRIITSSLDSTARVWDLKKGRCKILPNESPVKYAQFAHDEMKIFTYADHKTYIWDAYTGECLTTLRPSNPNIRAARSNDDLNYVIVVGDTGKSVTFSDKSKGFIDIWDITQQESIKHSINTLNPVISADFNPYELTAVTGSYDGDVQIWDVLSGDRLQKLKLDFITDNVLFTHNNATRLVKLGAVAYNVLFNHNGTRLMSSAYQDVKIWDNDNWRHSILARLASSIRPDQAEIVRRAYKLTQKEGAYKIGDNSHELFLLSSLGRLLPDGKIDYSKEAKENSRELQSLVNTFANIEIIHSKLPNNPIKKFRNWRKSRKNTQ